MRIILWALVVATCAIYMCGPVLDPDLWWHITIGRWIIAHQAIPHVDMWTLFSSGQPWRAYSWLIEILFAAVDHWQGIQGLLYLQVGFAVALGLALLWCYQRISGSIALGGLFASFVVLACFNHFTLRPQVIVWILFALLLGVLNDVQRHGFTRSRGIRMVLIMSLWANVHLSAVLGLLLVVTWLGDRKCRQVLVPSLVACFAGTLITPYFGGEWLTFISKTGHPFQHASVAEFQPATLVQYSTAFLVIALLAVATALYQRPGIFRPGQLLGAGIFLGGGLAVVKFLPFAVMVLIGMAAHAWREDEVRGDERLPLFEGLARLIALIERIPREGLSFLLICFCVVFVTRLSRNPINLNIVPQQAMDFFFRKQLAHPILNTFGNGGYVMYRLSESDGSLAFPVSIDGRTNLIPHELWEKHMAAYRGRENWREYIDMVRPNTILWKNESPLLAILRNGSEWCHVYQSGTKDSGYSLLVRKEFFDRHSSELRADNCGQAGAS